LVALDQQLEGARIAAAERQHQVLVVALITRI
jgi:hypothetical protein